jgi:hypothetical protein
MANVGPVGGAVVIARGTTQDSTSSAHPEAKIATGRVAYRDPNYGALMRSARRATTSASAVIPAVR